MCGPATNGTTGTTTVPAVAAQPYAIDFACTEQAEHPGQALQAVATHFCELRATTRGQQPLGSEAWGVCAR
ncbi:hypothetical protein EMIT0196MI5_180037 [Pseudomonas sp. IT-196MI5]